jgi:hypothetical protein
MGTRRDTRVGRILLTPAHISTILMLRYPARLCVWCVNALDPVGRS